jgi:hypothetical protein
MFIQCFTGIIRSSSTVLPHQGLIVDRLDGRSNSSTEELRYDAGVAADHVVKELEGELCRPTIGALELWKDERPELSNELLLPPQQRLDLGTMAAVLAMIHKLCEIALLISLRGHSAGKLFPVLYI